MEQASSSVSAHPLISTSPKHNFGEVGLATNLIMLWKDVHIHIHKSQLRMYLNDKA